MRKLGRSPLNRSLKRGIAILRAFRPGTVLLGNGEIAERTGLSRASISRLTQTLTDVGYLEYSAPQRAYRLGAPVLTLGHAMRSGSPVLRVATPLMTALARRLRINVGLAVRDGDEMVYLESVRFNAKGSQRSVVSGQRVPIELTALGRAWLAAAPETERKALMTQLKVKRRKRWRILGKGDRRGYILRQTARLLRCVMATASHCVSDAVGVRTASDSCVECQRDDGGTSGIRRPRP